MNITKDFISFIVNSHMYEKLALNHIENEIRFKNDYLIDRINISFTLPPEQAINNPFSVLTHKMFIEQIASQKVADHFSRKHINEFNLRKDQYIGCSVNLRGHNMFEFLQRWILLNQLEIFNLKSFIQSIDITNKSYSVGLTNLDAFEPVFSTFEKWALVPDNCKYGCYVNIINSYENGFINEILLSHIGLAVAS